MNFSKIDASLSGGKLYEGKKQAAPLFVCLLAPLLVPLSAILAGGLSFAFPIEGSLLIALALASILALSVSGLALLIILANNKLKKKIAVWLEDAAPLKAYATGLDKTRPLFVLPTETKLSVRFFYEGQKCIRISEGKSLGSLRGFHRAFTKYADRDINILYSPKHDEVLLLKEDGVQCD